ncbi:UNVERIFIED_CONTAM: Tropomyosin [Trichonephila clavipes]
MLKFSLSLIKAKTFDKRLRFGKYYSNCLRFNLRANSMLAAAEDEIRSLQRMIQSLENDLDRVQVDLLQANTVLEEKDKILHTHHNLVQQIRFFAAIRGQLYQYSEFSSFSY